jgi:DNA-binding XRE family transcriptional regulator
MSVTCGDSSARQAYFTHSLWTGGAIDDTVPAVPGEAPTTEALGFAVRELRTRSGLSQEQLGHRSGLHPTYISGIERGARNPSWRSIARLCDALGVRVSELARLSEEQGAGG